MALQSSTSSVLISARAVHQSGWDCTVEMNSEDGKFNYDALVQRREIVRLRLGELSSSGVDDTQALPGSKEVHWDLVMKEMVSYPVSI